MAKARQIVKRRKAVGNIRKITRTMQLIATARFQQAFNRATATKPFTKKITELVQSLSASGVKVDNDLLKTHPEATRDAMIVITSNRGLCGPYNGLVLRSALAHLRKPEQLPTELHVVGKKGIGFLKFLGFEMARRITDIDDRPRYEQVEPIAAEMIARYCKGEFRHVWVSYMRFISTGRQAPEVVQLLPLQVGTEGDAAPAAVKVQYDFSPEPQALLELLLPQSVKVRLYQCFTDAAVSEQVARMVAMKSATEAAEDMIKSLTRAYNRARQTQITLELLDIVGGAEGLS